MFPHVQATCEGSGFSTFLRTYVNFYLFHLPNLIDKK